MRAPSGSGAGQRLFADAAHRPAGVGSGGPCCLGLHLQQCPCRPEGSPRRAGACAVAGWAKLVSLGWQEAQTLGTLVLLVWQQQGQPQNSEKQ